MIIKQNYKSNKAEKNMSDQRLLLPPEMAYIPPYDSDEENENSEYDKMLQHNKELLKNGRTENQNLKLQVEFELQKREKAILLQQLQQIQNPSNVIPQNILGSLNPNVNPNIPNTTSVNQQFCQEMATAANFLTITSSAPASDQKVLPNSPTL